MSEQLSEQVWRASDTRAVVLTERGRHQDSQHGYQKFLRAMGRHRGPHRLSSSSAFAGILASACCQKKVRRTTRRIPPAQRFLRACKQAAVDESSLESGGAPSSGANWMHAFHVWEKYEFCSLGDACAYSARPAPSPTLADTQSCTVAPSSSLLVHPKHLGAVELLTLRSYSAVPSPFAICTSPRRNTGLAAFEIEGRPKTTSITVSPCPSSRLRMLGLPISQQREVSVHTRPATQQCTVHAKRSEST